MYISKFFKLIFSLLLPGAVGFISSLFTMLAVSTWYAEIAKPAFTPPDWIFAPAWTGLYVLMGFAFYEIWTNESPYKKKAVVFFIIQLVLNGLWSVIFFELQAPLYAFIELLFLLVFLLIATYYFYKIFKPTLWLLLPYILWLLYAGALNLGIIVLN